MKLDANSLTGVGALIAPLVATQFYKLPRWSFHFLVSLGLSVLNSIFLIIVFRFKTQDGKIINTRQRRVRLTRKITFRIPYTSG